MIAYILLTIVGLALCVDIVIRKKRKRPVEGLRHRAVATVAIAASMIFAATVFGSVDRKVVRVRVPPPAPRLPALSDKGSRQSRQSKRYTTLHCVSPSCIANNNSKTTTTFSAVAAIVSVRRTIALPFSAPGLRKKQKVQEPFLLL